MKIAATWYVVEKSPNSDFRIINYDGTIIILYLVGNVQASHNRNTERHFRDVCFALRPLHINTLAFQTTVR
jgi:hypothetical protein